MPERTPEEPPAPALTVHRAEERHTSAPEPGVLTRHAFSFSGHYDPANTHFGALLACNEELLAPGAGFAPHRHRDTEILTWVVEGALAHRDDRGHAAIVRPGRLQYLSAGSGVSHSERNVAGATEPVRFVQFWLQPEVFGAEPAYALGAVDEDASLLVSGARLRRGDAALHLLRAGPGRPLPALPEAPYRYLHVVRGGFGFRTQPGPRGVGRELGPGDSLRISGAAAPAGPVAGPDGVEVLLWAMHSGLRHG
ncbi:pirin family protein [Streptacidiphilus albus]|uniref:pirin family protein n=1 Tax=Streptacidiphilus albus TaxID=105425 RepID=UPI000690B3F0|nr:pirin family protein [Streptacidiphilus albus]